LFRIVCKMIIDGGIVGIQSGNWMITTILIYEDIRRILQWLSWQDNV